MRSVNIEPIGYSFLVDNTIPVAVIAVVSMFLFNLTATTVPQTAAITIIIMVTTTAIVINLFLPVASPLKNGIFVNYHRTVDTYAALDGTVGIVLGWHVTTVD